ncbi:MAG TPA: hypothetical protein VFE46_10720 [Pirellulales bacterium]|jgi:hypothetical protein|nr:hypothetical protein [Pirellulales bacterium]
MSVELSKPGIATETRPVSVCRDACERLARLIASQPIPADREDSSLQGFSRLSAGNFYLWLVAICHQTSPLGRLPLVGTVNGTRLRGWDYLAAKFENSVRADWRILQPSVWSKTSATQLTEMFRDQELGDRLTDVEGRADLIRNLGTMMIRNDWNHLEDLYRLSQTKIASGTPNLLGLLSTFRAYSDPVHKKSYFLLGLMRNSGYWTYADPELLGAPVDYHEVRGHLRIGTVLIADQELRRKLLSGIPVTNEEDIAIRRAVHDAIMLISDLSELRNPSQLHYLFWNVFRSCCTRESPHCLGCPSDCALPDRYVPLAIHPSGKRRCPFSDECKSAGRDPKYLEHVFETEYY